MIERNALTNLGIIAITVFINAGFLWIAQGLLQGMSLRTFSTYILAGLILAIVNFLIKTQPEHKAELQSFTDKILEE